MRRWPTLLRRLERPLAPPLKPHPPAPPELGDVIEPFLKSGGATFFLDTDLPAPPGFHPAPAGIQLVTSVYVPLGYVGFCKQLRVAPFMPSALADPWETAGVENTVTSWMAFDNVPGSPIRPGRNGVWETPFGWESYFDVSQCGEQPPQWTWQLRILQGTLANARRNHPAFNPLDPTSWYLVPDIAVPAAGYPNGIPGTTPGGQWGPQRMQVIQGDELDTHVLVPENCTLCLFTQWTQLRFQPAAFIEAAGDSPTFVEYATDNAGVFPILPSFGQLHGYMQATGREASIINSKFGWGG